MKLSEKEALQVFRDAGAFLEGHFILTSGLHSPHYVEKFRVLEHPSATVQLCEQIAENFRDEQITVVAGPATGGIILAFEVARQLGVRSIFTERANGSMEFRRGFSLTEHDRVLLVEDIVTTGGSIVKVIEAVQSKGANAVGLGYLVDRSGGNIDFGIPARALITLDVITMDPSECDLCAKGIPAVKPGSSGGKAQR